ncbi:hypothetical protein [Parapedobacter sp. SGR-10]|nr:hypothetical protein [Parapedobacter sp. SGR-10]
MQEEDIRCRMHSVQSQVVADDSRYRGRWVGQGLGDISEAPS